MVNGRHQVIDIDVDNDDQWSTVDVNVDGDVDVDVDVLGRARDLVSPYTYLTGI